MDQVGEQPFGARGWLEIRQGGEAGDLVAVGLTGFRTRCHPRSGWSRSPGQASSITYHPNGLFAQVTHANGVADLQERDPHDMARPRRLRTSGASEDLDTGVYDWDGAGNVTKMGAHRYVYDLLSRVTEASWAKIQSVGRLAVVVRLGSVTCIWSSRLRL